MASRRLFTTTLAGDLHLADLTAAPAYRFGVTGELATSADYTGPQAWAAAFYAAQFGGIGYHVRHDPRSRLAAVAVFGPGGGGLGPSGHSQELPASLLLDAAPFGIRIAADLPAEN